ncbi:MAG: metal-dependent hydrolase [Desulfobacteraceae bacterium]|jgi:hypothetical protein|nr:metal-dependent hydrolase [Desulfobacteraceae bacterium]MBT4363884.1 metal-dependent hydrolase [Desulfobacteraceae bacterium]
MAGFKSHLTGGIITGGTVSSVCFSAELITITQAIAIFIVGTMGGLLPDLDSDTGKPLTFLFSFVSILIPSMLYLKAVQFFGKSPEFIICYFFFSYLFINHIVCSTIKKITTHRGMMHSIPFAILCGGLGYLLFISSGSHAAFFAGFSIYCGCMIHLVLDELNSISFKFGFIPYIKKSSGTALKLKSDSIIITIFVYLLILLVTAAILMSS